MYPKRKLIITLILILLVGLYSAAVARSVMGGSGGDKRLDIFHYHNVGNIWMRVSNYGFFGSGDDVVPQWPSLEYPAGSGIDYLYQGAVWFGAKKQRRNELGEKLYWQNEAQTETGTIDLGFGRVIDTLCSVGFDGDADMYEFLPAYNPLEQVALGVVYDQYNRYDGILEASIREQKAGVDDDGDGWIDEDMPGFTFPFRPAVSEHDGEVLQTLPAAFADFGDQFPYELEPGYQSGTIMSNSRIWFPYGFSYLGYRDPDSLYLFAMSQDDDGDGLIDEDGAPMSEQDFIGYYYDYSPFGTPGERWWGGWNFSQGHTPLNVRVRQLSFQWSYEYIKNLVYIEFDITNMNLVDTLFDCAMGIYMDCDVGPQSWSADSRAPDDVSGYVGGKDLEFAYTRDYDFDGGLTPGYIGARVCTPIPDPDSLNYACWRWKVGDGPRDEVPGKKRNEKYWLLTGRNPDESKFYNLRVGGEDSEVFEYEEEEPCDTRFLFAFYGDQQGLEAPSDSTWNLLPGETMKIVVAVFPGESLGELKRTAEWAKTIYGKAQSLTEVILPDTFKHYEAPGPPDAPKMAVSLAETGDSIFVYWDNRSEFSYDDKIIASSLIRPDLVPRETADRLCHDFQGYTLWLASGYGEQDAYQQVDRWDKIDTQQDHNDYNCLINNPTVEPDNKVYFGGYLGIDKGLPQAHEVAPNEVIYTRPDTTIYWTDYFMLDSLYQFSPVTEGSTVYGMPLYAADVDSSVDVTGLTFDEEALLFKNPNVPDDIYLKLYDDRLIPVQGHDGQYHGGYNSFAEMRKARLARRYYKYTIKYPDKGVENYIAVTAFDRGIPERNLQSLESGKDVNRVTIFPGPAAVSDMNEIYVVPNPYIGQSKFDGKRERDEKGDRSKRIWFVNLPKECTIRIYTLAGDLVDVIEHRGEHTVDVINPSKAAHTGLAPEGMHSWDMLSKYDQIISSGVYLYSVEDHATGNVKVNKFAIIK